MASLAAIVEHSLSMIRYYGRRRPPVKTAVALEYRRGRDRAPLVTASGRGEVAEQILSAAREHGIHIEPDPDLALLLADVDLGQAIPPQLYGVVAEILSFVYKLNSARMPETIGGDEG